jgi:methionyl-tRNA formyltransferase
VVFKRIKTNEIKAETLDQFYDEIRMRDEDGQPLAYIDYGKFRLEFRRASLRRNHVEVDVKVYVQE